MYSVRLFLYLSLISTINLQSFATISVLMYSLFLLNMEYFENNYYMSPKVDFNAGYSP